MTDWREHLDPDSARDIGHLDTALGLRLGAAPYVEALIDPRGHLFQRLEYVGDAILDAVLLQALVLLQPWSESSLALVNGEQQSLVSDHALGKVAARRGLPQVRTFPVSRHRLGDRIEAAIGAAWADAGIEAAERVALHLVVTPGLRDQARRAGLPAAVGDARYEAASRACGHEPVVAAWFGAAAGGGPPRRRLAAVGNAVLEAAIATAQYVEEPDADEATMSEERRSATSNAVIARRAGELGLLREGEAEDSRAVADEVQALVGASTMDGGFLAGLQVASMVLGRGFEPGPLDPVVADAQARTPEARPGPARSARPGPREKRRS